MSTSRVVIVTRTFWPLVGAAGTAAARLAVGLVEAGWPVTVLTARWQKQWPSSIRFHDALVERLTPRPDGRWAEWRYQHAVGRWLHHRAGTLGIVYVFDLRQEANTALCAVGQKLPVVLRVQPIGPPTGHSEGLDIPRRLLTRHRAGVAALVCSCETTGQGIAAAGFPGNRIHVIPDGVATLSSRTTETRADARAMLAAANNTLRLPEWAPLAVYLGRLAGDRGLEYLVAAWPPIARQWPNARLWFVGEGPFRNSLRRQIAGLKLSGRAVLVGRFDHVEDLLAAADVLIDPGPREGPSMAAAEAMGAGLPVIAADCVGHRILIEHDHTGLLVPPGNIEALSEALVRVFGDPVAADRLGRDAQAHARRHFALAQMVDQHVTLFKALAPPSPA